jgi:DNA polymerase
VNPALRARYLEAMGIDHWLMRAPQAALPPIAARAQAPPPDGETATPVEEATPAAREAGTDWTVLKARVAACTRCSLAKSRTQTVFGVGDPNAEWLVVGEAPGAEEDRQGEPFVGRAGQLLNAMLRAIGLGREQVYIANVLKCRPPGNRDPAAAETLECLPYLEQQISLLKPRILLAVGRIAAQNLLRTDVTLGRLRQQVHHFGLFRVPLVVTYHPAYLLRTPADKRKAWEDLKFAREVCARHCRHRACGLSVSLERGNLPGLSARRLRLPRDRRGRGNRGLRHHVGRCRRGAHLERLRPG